ncbi:MAG: hydroxymethylbilane synthase [Legionellales bacterium]|nr:hydroxymethylbilane synthase [Legionellales bacterium]
MITKLRIATRNSPLALWQARYIAQQLSQHSPDLDIELVPMTTSGDRFLDHQTAPQGGKGLFVKEIEEALLQNRADIAVHSMKDVPAIQPDGLGIVAISQRENPYDAFVSQHYATLADLPFQASVGTSSIRRQSQLLAYRPDLKMISLRGNIQTRLTKISTIPCDAIILAAAGLLRMDLQDQIQEIIPEDLMLPACGQGALGIECRLDDQPIRAFIEALNDPLTALCVNTERQVNAILGGHCHVPLAVSCRIRRPEERPVSGDSSLCSEGDQLILQAKVLSADGTIVLSGSSTGPQKQASHLAQDCTQQLLAQGARQLLHCAS